MFILQIGEKHGMPPCVQQNIAEDTTSLLQHFAANYKKFLMVHLTKLGYEVDIDEELRCILPDEALIGKALSSLNSEFKMISYCKKHLGYIAPRD